MDAIVEPGKCFCCGIRVNYAGTICTDCAITPQKRRNKFNARRTAGRDGVVYDSKREAERASELQLLQAGGKISDLVPQVLFLLEVNGVHICDYRADFVYTESGNRIVEDCKGFRTREYKIKKALMKAVHGIEIRET